MRADRLSGTTIGSGIVARIVLGSFLEKAQEQEHRIVQYEQFNSHILYSEQTQGVLEKEGYGTSTSTVLGELKKDKLPLPYFPLMCIFHFFNTTQLF